MVRHCCREVYFQIKNCLYGAKKMSIYGEPHLQTSQSVTPDNLKWAYRINDGNRVLRDTSTEETKIESIHNIIDYLDVDYSERYEKRQGNTYCNIYAYDFADLGRTYIPRVWWDNNALEALQQGQEVQVIYGQTVYELNANALHDWFEGFGESYGWLRADNVMDLQACANSGGVGFIVAKRLDTSKSGHISAVVPEISGFQATQTNPVESQAGSNNYAYVVKGHQWWANTGRYSAFGLWMHE